MRFSREKFRFLNTLVILLAKTETKLKFCDSNLLFSYLILIVLVNLIKNNVVYLLKQSIYTYIIRNPSRFISIVSLNFCSSSSNIYQILELSWSCIHFQQSFNNKSFIFIEFLLLGDVLSLILYLFSIIFTTGPSNIK